MRRRDTWWVLAAVLVAVVAWVGAPGLALPIPSAEYRLNEGSGSTVADAQPGGLSGSIVGTENTNYRWETPGIPAGDPAKLHLNFGGSQVSYVTVPDQARLDAASAVTLSAWFNRDNVGNSDWHGVVAKRTDPGGLANYALNFNPGSNNLQWYFRPSGQGFQVLNGGWTPAPGIDWHFTGTHQQVGGNVLSRMYLNGVEIREGTFGGQNLANSQNNVPLTFGCSSLGTEMLRGTVDNVKVWNASALSPADVRDLHAQETGLTYFSLADVVGGGNGWGTGASQGIDPSTGAVALSHVGQIGPVAPTYHTCPLPLVDGVWVPDGGPGPNQLDSAGHVYAGFPNTNATAWDHVWNGANTGSESDLNGINFASAGHSLIGLHANKAVTFDLDAIRAANLQYDVSRFQTLVGSTYSSTADYWVFADGVLAASRMDTPGNVGNLIDLAIAPGTHFLTLVATDGSNHDYGYDQIIFGDPYLLLAPSEAVIPEPATLSVLGAGLLLAAWRRRRR